MKRATSFAGALLLSSMAGSAQADPPRTPARETIAPVRPAQTRTTTASSPARATAAPTPEGAANVEVLSGPSDLDRVVLPRAAEPDALPPPSARPLLLAAGVGTFALWYGGSVLQSYAWADAPAADKLRLPFVGPWMSLAKAGCGEDEVGCGTPLAVTRGVLAGLSGIGQIGSLVLLGEALLLRSAPQAVRGAEAPRGQREIFSASVKGFNLSTERDGVRFGVYGSF